MLVSNLSRFAVLLIEHEHARLLHSGPATTLASLRSPYWIVRGRQLVNSIIRQCVRCLRSLAKRSPQNMGDLPVARVDVGPPFAQTRIDYVAKVLQKEKEVFAEWSVSRGIRGKFIPHRAPHCGGARETMVKLTKNILRRQFGNAHMTVKQLVEIEAVLDSFPLVPLSPDASEDAITSSMLITGFNITNLLDRFVDSH
ncbi:uncharacterized protein [Lepeophtheirus salmonis]|uniref:uncharacterized protein n=1 Tax=Lepeophtheirus salmonis TaxID=72036 RepID=UPI003AF40130